MRKLKTTKELESQIALNATALCELSEELSIPNKKKLLEELEKLFSDYSFKTK